MIFTSPDEPRLRAGWRLILHTLLLVIFSVFVGTLFSILLTMLGIDFNTSWGLLANIAAMFIAITAATFLARRWLDKRSIASLGLQLGRGTWIDLLVGIGISAIQMALIFGIELAAGWTTFNGFAWQAEPVKAVLTGVGLWLAVFLMVGWHEELLSRGYHLQTLESGLNLFWAVLISSSVFGLLHFTNPGATWVSTLGILLAGAFLALPYVITRQLWLSIGLHIGWNFFEGVVFGFPVSGLETYHLLRHTTGGPELWTGGPFGPEAGLVVLPTLLLGSLLVVLYARSEFHRKGSLP